LFGVVVRLAFSEVSSWQALKQASHYMMELVGFGSLSHHSFVGVVVRLASSEVSTWQALKQAAHYIMELVGVGSLSHH
jgi:hypothetical protein